MFLPLLRHALGDWSSSGSGPAAALLGPAAASACVPVDVLQLPGRFELLVDLPGVDQTCVKLEVYDRGTAASGSSRDGAAAGPLATPCLVISGAPKAPELSREEQQQMVWLRRERRLPCPFRVLFALPADVDMDRITAAIDKGVLKVTLPRVEQQPPTPSRSIPVSRL